MRLVALLLALAAVACSSTTAGTVADASAPLDRSCTGIPGPSRVEGVDPATGCPALVHVERRFTVPMSCERLEPRCAIPPECRFTVTVSLPPSSGCGRPALALRFPACRCEFGVVECPSESPGWGAWPGCTANSLLCDPCRR